MDTSRDRLEHKAAGVFQATFGRPPHVVASAPGRVNLIGEHTDYNDGFVLPAAIDRFVAAAAAARSDGKLVMFSDNLGTTESAPVDDLRAGSGAPWAAYLKGVAALMRTAGVRMDGADLCVTGDVPREAGLSSSAALELATAFALRTLFAASISAMDMVFLCQRAEHEFAGVRCGIMDQYVSCFGREGHALFIDCRSLDSKPVRLPHALRLVVLHTGVGRGLGASEYNLRREQCAGAVAALSTGLPQIRALRDVSPAQLDARASSLNPLLLRRARHVITENDRVGRAVEALHNLQLDELGKLMYDSHHSLRTDYEVSCDELDAMVDICARCDGVVGARMTGGGFGGSAICLAREDAVPGLAAHVEREYPARTGKKPTVSVCTAVSGARAAVFPPPP